MNKMVQLKEKGVTVICTIHQPRAEIFRLFSSFLLLVKGQVIYQGARPVEYFTGTENFRFSFHRKVWVESPRVRCGCRFPL